MSSKEETNFGSINPAFAEDELEVEKNGMAAGKPLELSEKGKSTSDNSDFYDYDDGDSDKAPSNNKQDTTETGLEDRAQGVEDIDNEFEDDDYELDKGCMANITRLQAAIDAFWERNKGYFKKALILVALLLYFAYFTYAMIHNFGSEGSIRLLWITCLFMFGIVLSLVMNRFGDDIQKLLSPLTAVVSRHSLKINLFLLSCIFVAFVIVIIVDLTVYHSTPYNLVSLSGIAVYVFLCFITSLHPSRIKWRTVGWGFGLQVAMAMMVLRWQGGYWVFKWIGDRLFEYFEYINVSCIFIFGPTFMDHFIAMKLLPTVVFVSSTISVLFYMGVMQWFIFRISKLMEVTMDTTAGESVSAARNIFVGQIEASIIIKPIIAKMTLSEIHAIMTGGFATIAGSVMAAYILFGVPPNHLISASVMSAPAALAISKISYPETKKSKTFVKDIEKIIGKSPDANIVEAASSGAISSIPLIASIFVNLIAFISILEFLNATLTWFGDQVGSPIPITFQFFCSYLLWPFAFVMGVSMKDCGRVAELIGVKVFINEFVAFEQLGMLIKNKKMFEEHLLANGTWSSVNYGKDILLHNSTGNSSTTLFNAFIEDRSTVISTYALCGFSNFSSIGIQLGALCSMVPNRKSAFSKLAIRTMLAGNIACFVTACIAGVLYKES